ncbi:MAG: hypothetical protein IBV53_00940 [Candidatus Atribacteria bacterium]
MTKKEPKLPWECTYAKEDKSKCRPGNKPKADQKYFEILCFGRTELYFSLSIFLQLLFVELIK